MQIRPVIIIGGGIGGLIASIQLSRNGIGCTVIEKKNYPAHKVCGEYISNEALRFLTELGLIPDFDLPRISRFQLSSVSGKSKTMPLDLGGFGISRYQFDHHLFQKALEAGVEVITDTTVETVVFGQDRFIVSSSTADYAGQIVLGAFGKRSVLDVKMQRSFVQKRSPYIGVKYHVQCDFPEDLIALHNFPGGYCGISRVENNIVNVCYLSHRDKLRQFHTIPAMEENVLWKNPLLKEILRNATPLFQRPETINEINFETKAPVENHIFMLGDAAGMITPLCGNGMAMAIHSAKLAADSVAAFFAGKLTRIEAETRYTLQWNETFRQRLWAGRQIQRLFGSEKASAFAVNLAIHVSPLADFIVRNTHGKPF